MITTLENFISQAKIDHGSNVTFGSSILLIQKGGIYFAMVKPKNWRLEPNGLLAIDFSGIGGGMETKESPYQCALRELNEEVGLQEKDLIVTDLGCKTILIKNNKRSAITLLENNEVSPIIIFYHKIEKLYLRQNQDKDSYLVLFIYIAKLKSKKIPKISASEEIPGLIFINKSNFGALLKDRVIYKSHLEDPLYKVLFKNKYLKYIPPVFLLKPKFTPSAFAKSWPYIKKITRISLFS